MFTRERSVGADVQRPPGPGASLAPGLRRILVIEAQVMMAPGDDAGEGAATALSGVVEAPADLPRAYGWKEIAGALRVGVRTAQEFARRNRDPLPVEFGHKGVWAYVSWLRDWMRRQNMPFLRHLELVTLRRKAARRRRRERAA